MSECSYSRLEGMAFNIPDKSRKEALYSGPLRSTLLPLIASSLLDLQSEKINNSHNEILSIEEFSQLQYYGKHVPQVPFSKLQIPYSTIDIRNQRVFKINLEKLQSTSNIRVTLSFRSQTERNFFTSYLTLLTNQLGKLYCETSHTQSVMNSLNKTHAEINYALARKTAVETLIDGYYSTFMTAFAIMQIEKNEIEPSNDTYKAEFLKVLNSPLCSEFTRLVHSSTITNFGRIGFYPQNRIINDAKGNLKLHSEFKDFIIIADQQFGYKNKTSIVCPVAKPINQEDIIAAIQYYDGNISPDILIILENSIGKSGIDLTAQTIGLVSNMIL